MKNLFESTSSNWVRYNAYELKKDKGGMLYLTAAQGAKPAIYDPLKDSQSLVRDALNIGRLRMSKQSEKK